MSSLTPEQEALYKPVKVKETDFLSQVLKVTEDYYSYRHVVYRFGSNVVIKDKLNPYSNTEEYKIFWKS